MSLNRDYEPKTHRKNSPRGMPQVGSWGSIWSKCVCGRPQNWGCQPQGRPRNVPEFGFVPKWHIGPPKENGCFEGLQTPLYSQTSYFLTWSCKPYPEPVWAEPPGESVGLLVGSTHMWDATFFKQRLVGLMTVVLILWIQADCERSSSGYGAGGHLSVREVVNCLRCSRGWTRWPPRSLPPLSFYGAGL